MSHSPVTDLRKAIRNALLADATLVSMLAGPNLFDEAPREAIPPYIAFGDVILRDLSTATDTGAEHFVILNVWSIQRGLHEALDIADRAVMLLQDASLTLDYNHLVNLRLVSIESKRENNGRFARASLRFRAFTEAL